MCFQLIRNGFPQLRKLEMITEGHHLRNLGGNSWLFVMLFFMLLCSSLIKKQNKKPESGEHSELSKHKKDTKLLQEEKTKPMGMNYKKLPDSELTEK